MNLIYAYDLTGFQEAKLDDTDCINFLVIRLPVKIGDKVEGIDLVARRYSCNIHYCHLSNLAKAS